MCNGKMFCYQCQETAQGKGCSIVGVCGKKAETANLQDLLIYITKSVAICSSILRRRESISREVERYLINSLFITITNANFDDEAIIAEIRKGLKDAEGGSVAGPDGTITTGYQRASSAFSSNR